MQTNKQTNSKEYLAGSCPSTHINTISTTRHNTTAERTSSCGIQMAFRQSLSTKENEEDELQSNRQSTILSTTKKNQAGIQKPENERVTRSEGSGSCRSPQSGSNKTRSRQASTRARGQLPWMTSADCRTASGTNTKNTVGRCRRASAEQCCTCYRTMSTRHD